MALPRPSLAALVAVALGCAPNGPAQFIVSTRDAGGTVTDAAVSVDALRPIPVRDSGVDPNCSEAAQLVYVLSEANELYSFRPNLRQFTRIGTLNCPTRMQPNSMAIDRNAVAWVNFVDSSLGDTAGSVYRVNTTTAACTSDAPIDLPDGWFRLGMGFSTANASDTSETLFVTSTGDPLGASSLGLGRIDAASASLVPVGAFSGSLRGQSAELTGTGDGRLFGFFTTTPVQVAQIDKENASILNAVPVRGVETPSAWAFSFWGGDFYLYTAPSALTGRTTNVTRYRPSDGSINTAYMTNIGFRIVGAGVSTCAPIAPPP